MQLFPKDLWTTVNIAVRYESTTKEACTTTRVEMSVPSVPRRCCESGDSRRSHGGKAGPQVPSCQSGKMEKKLGTGSEEQGHKMRASRGCPLWPDQVLHYQGRKLSRPMRSCVDSVKKRPTINALSCPTLEGCCLRRTSGPAEGAGYQLPEASNPTETLISLHPDNTLVKRSPVKGTARVSQQREENRPASPVQACDFNYL